MFSIIVDSEIELRLLDYNDAEVFLKVMNENRDYLEKFMPRITETKTVDDAKRVIGIFIKQLYDNNGFRVGIFYKNQFAGVVGLKYIDWLNEKTEIMCWVSKKFSGNGIGTRSQMKVIEITFEHYGLNKLFGKPSTLNTPSIKMMEKCGFISEGTSCEEEKLGSVFTDVLLFYITKKMYLEAKK